MANHKRYKAFAPALALVLLLTLVFSVPARAVEEETVTLPAGQNTFTYDLVVDETEPYAGIEFGLTLSDEAALTFTDFTLSGEVAGAVKSPFVTVRGVHYFGFYRASNAFSGRKTVGTLHFTYTGSLPQTITLVELQVVRLDGDNEPVGTQRPAPVLTIAVSRASGGDPTDPPGPADPPTETLPGDANPPLGGGWVNPYDDVDEGDWFYDEVQYLTENGLMNGVGNSLFAPGEATTRAMPTAILYRYEGEPHAHCDTVYDDVPTGEWYTDPVTWACENGVVEGYGNGKFAPEELVTREQLVLILYRDAQRQGRSVAAQSSLSAFTDANKVSDWALPAVKWAVQAGLLKGRTATTIEPQGQATRAELAVLFYRYFEDLAPAT
jgi:hypothetical protein